MFYGKFARKDWVFLPQKINETALTIALAKLKCNSM